MRLPVAPALLAALATLSECKDGAPQSRLVDADAGAQPQAGQASEVLARVGDRTITVGDFSAAVEHMDEFDRLRYRAPDRRKELLSEMIDVMLLADEARARGYDKTPEAQEEVRQILRDAVLKQARDGAPAPDDIPASDVRAYYEAHKADFHEPSRRRVSAIVTVTESAAQTAIDAIRKDPSLWGELVRTRSVDPGAKADVPGDLAGDLGFVSPPGDARGQNARIPEPVRAAAFDLPSIGDVSPRPLRVERRFYVVKLAGKTEGHDRTLQDVERTLRVKLAQDAAKSREDALVAELRREIPVQIDEAALAQVRVGAPDAGP